MLLNKHDLAPHAVCSKENSKYSLTSMQITPKESAATDGHILMIVEHESDPIPDEHFPNVPGLAVPDDSPDFASFLLPAEKAKELLKSLPGKKNPIPVLERIKVVPCGENVQLATTNLDSTKLIEVKRNGDRLPNYHLVIPEKEKAVTTICFDAKLMVRLLNALIPVLDEFQNGHGYARDAKYTASPVVMRIVDENYPIRFDGTSPHTNQKTIAALMPMKMPE